jgi:hypothetical protein
VGCRPAQQAHGHPATIPGVGVERKSKNVEMSKKKGDTENQFSFWNKTPNLSAECIDVNFAGCDDEERSEVLTVNNTEFQ